MVKNKDELERYFKALIKAVSNKREKIIKENGWNPNIIDQEPYEIPDGTLRTRWKDFIEAALQLRV